MRISLSPGVLSGNGLIPGIKTLLGKQEITVDLGDTIAYTGISVNTQQAGETIMVRTCSLSGDGAQISLFGKYSYAAGLDLSGNGRIRTIVKKGDDEFRQEIYVPLQVKGPLARPCANLAKPRESEAYCF